MNKLIDKVIKWHQDRNLIKGSTDQAQLLKLIEELGELSNSVCKGKDIRDDLGDMMVVMINIMKRNNLTMEECLNVAYEDIKNRKGCCLYSFLTYFNIKLYEYIFFTNHDDSREKKRHVGFALFRY